MTNLSQDVGIGCEKMLVDTGTHAYVRGERGKKYIIPLILYLKPHPDPAPQAPHPPFSSGGQPLQHLEELRERVDERLQLTQLLLLVARLHVVVADPLGGQVVLVVQ